MNMDSQNSGLGSDDKNKSNEKTLLKKNSASDTSLDVKVNNTSKPDPRASVSPEDAAAAKERGQYFKPPKAEPGAPAPGAHTYSIDHMEASIRETIMQCFGRGMGDVAREIRTLTRSDQEKFNEMERSMVRMEQNIGALKDKLQVRKKSDKGRESVAADEVIPMNRA